MAQEKPHHKHKIIMNPSLLDNSALPKNRITRILKILISVVVIAGIYFLVKGFIKNTEAVTTLAKSAGTFGPIVLILITSLGIVLSPIPSTAFIIVAGYLYGTWWGAVYAFLGHMIAATATFAIARMIKMKHKGKIYKKYKLLIMNNKSIIYLLYIIPIIPISVTSIVYESTGVSWKKFFEVITCSFLPVVLFFSFFGNIISKRNLILLAVVVIIFFVGFLIVKRKIDKSKKSLQKKSIKK